MDREGSKGKRKGNGDFGAGEAAAGSGREETADGSEELTRRRVRRWRERERPAPSTIWQAIGIAVLFSALGTAVAALTVSDGAPVSGRELWIVTLALVVWAITMFVAHWDANRGRRSKHYEREELPPLDPD